MSKKQDKSADKVKPETQKPAEQKKAVQPAQKDDLKAETQKPAEQIKAVSPEKKDDVKPETSKPAEEKKSASPEKKDDVKPETQKPKDKKKAVSPHKDNKSKANIPQISEQEKQELQPQEMQLQPQEMSFIDQKQKEDVKDPNFSFQQVLKFEQFYQSLDNNEQKLKQDGPIQKLDLVNSNLIEEPKPLQIENSMTEEEQYFEKLDQIIKEKHRNVSKSCIQKANQKLEQQLVNGKIKISDTSLTISDILQYKQIPTYEEQLKKHKLQEAEKNRQILQQKLKQVKADMEILENQVKTEKQKTVQSLEPFTLQDDEHKKFIKEKKEEWMKMQQNREEQLKKLEEKNSEKMRQIKENEQKKLEQQKNTQKEESQKKIQEILERQKARKQKQIEEMDQIKQILSKTPNYVSIQEKFKQQEQDLKKSQSTKKNMKIDLSIDEINIHQEKYIQILKEKQEEQRKYLKEKEKIVYQKPSYESRMFQICETEQQEKQKQTQEMETLRKEAKQRQKEYYEKIKIEHCPRIDIKKQQEILEISKISNAHKQRVKSIEEIHSLGNNYLHAFSQNNVSIRHKDKVKTEMNLYLPAESTKTTQSLNTYPNYLPELRSQRGNISAAQYQINKINKLIEQDVNYSIQNIIYETQKLQEQGNRYAAYQKDDEKNQDITEIYLAQIKAKLQILDKINS